MPIDQGSPISVTPILKLVLNTSEESITVDTLGSIDTFAEVVALIMKPGASSIPGATTFSIEDLVFAVSLDNSLAAGKFVVSGTDASVAEDVLDALVARYPLPVSTEEVSGVKQFVLTLSTSHDPSIAVPYNEQLKSALLSKLGSLVTDDITPEEAFAAILQVAGISRHSRIGTDA